MHDANCDLIPSQAPQVKLHRILTGTGKAYAPSTSNHTRQVPGPLWSEVAGQGQAGSESLTRLSLDCVP